MGTSQGGTGGFGFGGLYPRHSCSLLLHDVAGDNDSICFIWAFTGFVCTITDDILYRLAPIPNLTGVPCNCHLKRDMLIERHLNNMCSSRNVTLTGEHLMGYAGHLPKRPA